MDDFLEQGSKSYVSVWIYIIGFSGLFPLLPKFGMEEKEEKEDGSASGALSLLDALVFRPWRVLYLRGVRELDDFNSSMYSPLDSGLFVIPASLLSVALSYRHHSNLWPRALYLCLGAHALALKASLEGEVDKKKKGRWLWSQVVPATLGVFACGMWASATANPRFELFSGSELPPLAASAPEILKKPSWWSHAWDSSAEYALQGKELAKQTLDHAGKYAKYGEVAAAAVGVPIPLHAGIELGKVMLGEKPKDEKEGVALTQELLVAVVKEGTWEEMWRMLPQLGSALGVVLGVVAVLHNVKKKQ